MKKQMRLRAGMSALLAIVVILVGVTACSEHERGPEGRTVAVRAPYTDVNVFIPEDDDEDVQVDVDVDD